MKTLILAVTAVLAFDALADPAQAVRCREIGFSIAAESRDAERFESFIDDDARFVSNTVLRGPAEITEAWSVFFAEEGPTIKWRPKIVEVLEDGKLALSRGTYRVNTPDADGNAVESWGTFNSIWRLQDDGSWKVVFDAGSPAAEAPGEEERALLDEENDC